MGRAKQESILKYSTCFLGGGGRKHAREALKRDTAMLGRRSLFFAWQGRHKRSSDEGTLCKQRGLTQTSEAFCPIHVSTSWTAHLTSGGQLGRKGSDDGRDRLAAPPSCILHPDVLFSPFRLVLSLSRYGVLPGLMLVWPIFFDGSAKSPSWRCHAKRQKKKKEQANAVRNEETGSTGRGYSEQA